jgi:hypothetical protein
MPSPISGVQRVRQDLAAYGVVTQVIDATTFVVAGLAGLGDGALVGYGAYVLTKANGTITAPRGEAPAVTAYVSATGQINHAAYTVPVAVGDQLLLIHPTLSTAFAAPLVVGNVVANWQTAETNLVLIGTNDTRNKLHSLMIDMNAIAGTLTIRIYSQINGVERRIYQQAFTVAADGPGRWTINGAVGIHEILRVTCQSNLVADNGVVIAYDYMLEAM